MGDTWRTPVNFDKAIDYSILSEKSALVTGGSSGLGAAFVTLLAEAGAHVVIGDVDETLGKQLEQSLTSAGRKVKFAPVDVSSWDSQVRLFEQSLQWLPTGEFDIVVTSAGIGGQRFDVSAASPDALRDVHGVNACARSADCIDITLLGVLYTVQLAAKYGMGRHQNNVRPGSKSIVLVGSLASYRGIPNLADYSAVKYGVRGMFKTLRQLLSPTDIRCNMLAPAFVKTPMTAARIDALEAQGVRFAKIEHVAEAVARLCADESIHGRVLAISAQGVSDLCDDPDGMEGAVEVAKLPQRKDTAAGKSR